MSNPLVIKKLQQEIRQKDLERKTTLLEAVGDLPTADAKPDDKILFVCKLNKITLEK